MTPEGLKVCHVASGDLLGGAEVLLLNLANASSKEILDQTLFVLFNNGILSEKLVQRGAKVFIIQEMGFPADILIIFKLARLLRQEGTHVVHTHGYKSNVIGGIASQLSGCSLVIRTEHGKPLPISKHGLSKATLFSLLDHFVGRYWTDKIIAVSSDLSRMLAEKYPLEKILTIYNGLDLLQFDAKYPKTNLKSEFGMTDENKFIGIFSRLNPEKGVSLFLKAAKLISLKNPHVRFFIVGDGPLCGELKEEAALLNLEKYVIFTGFRGDAIDLLCQMDVVVLSSVHEGMPMILLEAMALQKPVVATRVGGIPEVVDDRRTGILVQPGDDYSLAMACLEIIENRAMAKQFGVKAREDIERRFTAQIMLSKLMALYWDCFQKSRKDVK